MVLFDYECPKCEKVEERLVDKYDDPVRCSCGAVMKKLITIRNTRDWFPEGGMWVEHVAPHPIFVTSKRHLKEVCEKHGGYSVALLNENKGTGVSQTIGTDNDRAWRKSKARKETERIVDEAYRRSFGDT